MEQFLSFLQEPLFSFAGQEFSAGRLLLLPLILLIAWLIYRLVVRLIVNRLEKVAVDPDLIHLVRRLLLVAFLLIVFLSVLDLLDVPITAFAFMSGAVAIGVGFGAQNIINNFISGWILMWEKPIRIGDFLELGEVRGKVESINTRSTLIRRVDGVHMLIPNSQLLENTVVNWTLIDKMARSIVRVGVAYGSPVERVRDIMMEIADKHADVLDDPQPLVLFEDFGDSSLVFDLVFWVMAGSERDLRVIRSDLRFEIDRRFREEGIVIAFPQRDVHLNSVAPIDVRVVEQG
jgi:small-conductance mechanosensitive channel